MNQEQEWDCTNPKYVDLPHTPRDKKELQNIACAIERAVEAERERAIRWVINNYNTLRNDDYVGTFGEYIVECYKYFLTKGK